MTTFGKVQYLEVLLQRLVQIRLKRSSKILLHTLLVQADLKARAKEMDERREEEERMRRGEKSAVETIYSDEVNLISFGACCCLYQ